MSNLEYLMLILKTNVRYVLEILVVAVIAILILGVVKKKKLLVIIGILLPIITTAILVADYNGYLNIDKCNHTFVDCTKDDDIYKVYYYPEPDNTGWKCSEDVVEIVVDCGSPEYNFVEFESRRSRFFDVDPKTSWMKIHVSSEDDIYIKD